MKKCKKCFIKKDFSCFHRCSKAKDKLSSWCKECKSLYHRKWRKDNKEHFDAYQKSYYVENKEKRHKKLKEWKKKNEEHHKRYVQTYNQEYRKKNKEQIRESQRDYKKQRIKKDPGFRIKLVISSVVRNAFRKQKQPKLSPTWKILSYTPQQLKEHLENQFEPWMSWDNYGRASNEKRTWNIDHIIPQSRYDFSDPKQLKECWSLENLRPLEAIENIKKSNKL